MSESLRDGGVDKRAAHDVSLGGGVWGVVGCLKGCRKAQACWGPQVLRKRETFVHAGCRLHPRRCQITPPVSVLSFCGLFVVGLWLSELGRSQQRDARPQGSVQSQDKGPGGPPDLEGSEQHRGPDEAGRCRRTRPVFLLFWFRCWCSVSSCVGLGPRGFLVLLDFCLFVGSLMHWTRLPVWLTGLVECSIFMILFFREMWSDWLSFSS